MADLLIGSAPLSPPWLRARQRMERRLAVLPRRLRGDEVTDEEVIAAIRSVPTHFTDLTITAANVTPGAGATYGSGTAGVTVTAGQSLYLDPVAGTLKLANAVTTVVTAACIGIAAHAALAGQRLDFFNDGVVNFGAILTAGKWYVVSGANFGGIAPMADLASTWFSSVVGFALTTSALQMRMVNTGVVLA